MIIHSRDMIAPCGMNCTYCYVHHKKKKPCQGCRMSGEHKPASCRKCKIRECTLERKLQFCYECSEYPCAVLKRLNKSYEKRYEESLIQKLRIIEINGIDYYMSLEKERLKCSECGGELNMHDKICNDCMKKNEVKYLAE